MLFMFVIIFEVIYGEYKIEYKINLKPLYLKKIEI